MYIPHIKCCSLLYIYILLVYMYYIVCEEYNILPLIIYLYIRIYFVCEVDIMKGVYITVANVPSPMVQHWWS